MPGEPLHFQVTPIAYVHSCFTGQFAIPRQAGLAPNATATIHFVPPFGDPAAFTGLHHCSHLWLQFVFHLNKHANWQPRVRPPRLGGNRTLGVFATRSPYRPNALGLSCVRLEAITEVAGQVVLEVSGVDLVDGTPVVDIKPYLPYADAIAAENHFAPAPPAACTVVLTEAAVHACNTYLAQTGRDLERLIVEVLQQDPRPAYHQAAREYGFTLWDRDVRWRAHPDGNEPWLEVLAVLPLGCDR